MEKYLKAEFLKLKNSRINLMIISILLLICIFSFFIMGYVNFYYGTLFWWEAIFFIILINLLIYLDEKKENKAGNYQNILVLNISVEKVLYAKVIVCCIYSFISNLGLFIILFFGSKFFGVEHPNFINIIIGFPLVWVSIVWAIPFIYFVSEYINHILFITTNFFISIFIAPFLAQTKFYFLLPYTYIYRVCANFFNIKPTGEVLQKIEYISFLDAILPNILSILIFIIFLKLASKKYLKYKRGK